LTNIVFLTRKIIVQDYKDNKLDDIQRSQPSMR